MYLSSFIHPHFIQTCMTFCMQDYISLWLEKKFSHTGLEGHEGVNDGKIFTLGELSL